MPPAPLGRRIIAGLLDAAIVVGLAAAYFLVPLLTQGVVLPMWGVLAAVLGYSVVPLGAFRATLGMRLCGLQLVALNGHPANPGDLLFRELIGRGFFPAAFLLTLAMGFVASLLGVATFLAPSGMSAVLAYASVFVLAAAVLGTFLALQRPDRRTLADLVSRTMVIRARPEAAPEDEDERAERSRRRRRRIAFVVAFELVVAGGVSAVPFVLTRRTESVESYADRHVRARLEREHQETPANALAAEQLADIYTKAGRLEDAAAARKRHTEAAIDGVQCNKRRALELGERLNRDGDHGAALLLVERFLGRCGEWPRLLWVSMVAREQRGEWKEAALVATQLIEDAPEDSDFWWWRGQANAERGEYEQAASDYHQSMANRPNGFAAGRYAKWAEEKLARPCEAAFALQYWLEQRPDQEEDWALERRSELFLAGGCDKLAGRGKATLRFEPGQPVVKVAARLNGKPAQLVISGRTSYTLVGSAFASRIGLKPSEQPAIEVRAAGKMVPARLVELDRLGLGKASAERLRVAVVEELPEGTDAILGVNFFWRFLVTAEPDGLLLSARKATRP
ncbi:MAG: RDD family protein [Myxococcales bacterium]|nr:RDD family protein [Myxococcales bacterium]